MMKPIKLSVAITALLTISACSLMPDYQRPDPSIAIANQSAEDSINVAELGWKDFYLDPKLEQLISIALANNQNLKISSLTVEQLREQFRIQKAAKLPTVNAEGSVTRQRTPGSLNARRQSEITDTYSVGLGISAWELDFFGRIDSLSESALQQFLASKSARDSMQLTLIAQVADAWFSWLASNEQQQLSSETRKARDESYQLIEKRFKSGLASELDVRQAETALHEARVLEVQYQQQANQNFTNLQLLVGQTLDKDEWKKSWYEMKTLRDIPANLTSDVLLKRPDVMQAEYTIKSANADIGAARAAFFPRISLTTSLGFGGTSFGQLGEASSRQWAIAPQFTLPLLDWGVNKANLNVAELQKDINIAKYQQVIQEAFKEVRDEMEARYTLDAQLEAQNDLTASTKRSLQLAQYRFDAGIDSYLDVLDAQRSSINSELSQIDTRLLRLRNQLTLYKALGGGLYEETP
ncbi:efflux transporter outer membrane subunit [Methylophaga sulfidovorans]|uniref:Outer membrane protein, multidrug efflux system n=1 Tax=Methylophaga sulfidovorans TaxID=45496 RepID=A0A1I3XZV2_9GAMM|nr:efflux transporter outer membrane subunit [Methylophaga sulfidovorans]SFK25187.1 outer membrane protein, multidrug efflux system [Methylophaga sulfidovorans]